MAASTIAVLSQPAPARAAPKITGLRVSPRRVGKRGRATIHFELNRPAVVAFTRKRMPRGGHKARHHKLGPGRVGVAGANKITVRAAALGHQRGRYRLIATARADGAGPVHSFSRYRILPRGK